MRLLLDTHAFLWFVMGDPRLSVGARAAIELTTNTKYVSVASAWEIAIKVSIGKLKLAEAFAGLIPREISSNGFLILPIDLTHINVVGTLPFHHRDPFDRMLVAQTLVGQMSLVSGDASLDA